LPGDQRGYVKNGEIFDADASLAYSSRRNLVKDPVTLTRFQRKIVEGAIRVKADEISQQIYALAVCSNHVHIVVGYTTKDLGLIVRYYKMVAQTALRNAGFAGRLWTKGFDKRFCFDEQSLHRRIDYVDSHNAPNKNLAPQFIRGSYWLRLQGFHQKKMEHFPFVFSADFANSAVNILTEKRFDEGIGVKFGDIFRFFA
jgi:REP element-mobilizing transposase RayT